MKIECSRQVWTERTKGRTNISITWAPVGAKKCKSLLKDTLLSFVGTWGTGKTLFLQFSPSWLLVERVILADSGARLHDPVSRMVMVDCFRETRGRAQCYVVKLQRPEPGWGRGCLTTHWRPGQSEASTRPRGPIRAVTSVTLHGLFSGFGENCPPSSIQWCHSVTHC